MTLIGIFKVFVELKYTFVFGIDRVVCQVHEKIWEILPSWSLVSIGTESGKTFFEKINVERVNRQDQDIEPAIKFQIINQQRLFDILLYHIMVLWIDILKSIRQKYTFTLARGLRLDYIHRFLIVGFICKTISKITIFRREQESPREELILFWELFLHLNQVTSQMILAAQLKHSGKVIGLLIWFHLGNLLRLHTGVRPIDIPIFICILWWLFALNDNIIIWQLSTLLFINWFERYTIIKELLCHETYYKILGWADIHHEPLLLFELWIFVIIFYSYSFAKHMHFLINLLLSGQFLLLFLFRLLSVGMHPKCLSWAHFSVTARLFVEALSICILLVFIYIFWVYIDVYLAVLYAYWRLVLGILIYILVVLAVRFFLAPPGICIILFAILNSWFLFHFVANYILLQNFI